MNVFILAALTSILVLATISDQFVDAKPVATHQKDAHFTNGSPKQDQGVQKKKSKPTDLKKTHKPSDTKVKTKTQKADQNKDAKAKVAQKKKPNQLHAKASHKKPGQSTNEHKTPLLDQGNKKRKTQEKPNHDAKRQKAKDQTSAESAGHKKADNEGLKESVVSEQKQSKEVIRPQTPDVNEFESVQNDEGNNNEESEFDQEDDEADQLENDTEQLKDKVELLSLNEPEEQDTEKGDENDLIGSKQYDEDSDETTLSSADKPVSLLHSIDRTISVGA